jgi:hypothetical protein
VNHVQGRKLLHGYLEGELEAAQRARLDAHLAECADCAQEVRELRETVSLLHSLSGEEEAPQLADVVMDRIAAGEGRPSRLAVAFRGITSPGAGLALAAGLAGLLVFSTVQFGSPGLPGGAPSPTPADVADTTVAGGGGLARPRIQRREAPAPAPSRVATRTLTRPPVVLDVSSAGAGRSAQRPAPFRGVAPPVPHRIVPNTVLLDLVDAELDGLLRDPDAFVALMLGTSEGERVRSIARLAARAEARGDQAEVIRRLRAVDHPFGPHLAARFEHRAQVMASERAER